MSPSPSAALLPPTMERILDPSGVTFDAAARTLTFTGTVPLSLAHILRVVNLTRGEFYFDSTGNNGQGLTQSATFASPVLTLHHRLDGAENTDTLAVLYDDGSAGGGGGGGGGDASAALQTQQLTQITAINTDLGAPADAPAGTDDASVGLIPLWKRGLQRLTTLIGHVDGLEGSATAIEGKLPALIGSRGGVEPLGQPGVARQLAAGAASANVALTSTCRRVSIHANGAAVRFAIGSSAQTATATSHYLASGETKDFLVPATPNIAAIRGGTTDGVLEITELV